MAVPEPNPGTERNPPLERPPQNRSQVVFFWLSAAVAVLGVVGGLALPRPAQGTAPTGPDRTAISPPRRLVPFTLTDSSGHRVDETLLKGRFVIANLIFTSCSLSCLEVNRRMAELQEQFLNTPDILLLSVTVDPRTDSPEALAAFARKFGANHSKWAFLTGDKAQLRHLIGTTLFPQATDPTGSMETGFTHTDRILLLTPEGETVASFNGMDKGVAGRIAAEVSRLRSARR